MQMPPRAAGLMSCQKYSLGREFCCSSNLILISSAVDRKIACFLTAVNPFYSIYKVKLFHIIVNLTSQHSPLMYNN